MRKIIEVLDCFELQNLGVIITGVNPEFDRLHNDEIKRIIGDEIVIRSPSDIDVKVKVSDIDIGISLIGRKNISICFGEYIKKSDIKQNSTIFSLDCTV